MTRRPSAMATALAAALAVVGPASAETAAAASTDADKTITVARLPLSMYSINAAFVEIVAEEEGFSVTYLDGVHPDLFPALANGEADILTSIWLPYGHDTYWEAHKDEIITLGAIFQNGVSFFVVPDYVDESVQSVNDLADPEMAERFQKVIPSIHRGTSMYDKSVAVVEQYGLDAVGFEVEAGTVDSWNAALGEAIENRAWIVFPLWEPQYMNEAFDVRPLVEPQGVFGGREATFLAANRAWARSADPALLSALSRINVSLEDLNRLDYQVNVEGMAPRAAVEAYLEARPGLLERWTD
ncbi:MAG: glycine betaine ABC transporter substrate-binding protein [Pseudomonadota bacterium]